jgi:hypothetical protein
LYRVEVLSLPPAFPQSRRERMSMALSRCIGDRICRSSSCYLAPTADRRGERMVSSPWVTTCRTEAHCSEQWEKSYGMLVEMGLEGNH